MGRQASDRIYVIQHRFTDLFIDLVGGRVKESKDAAKFFSKFAAELRVKKLLGAEGFWKVIEL